MCFSVFLNSALLCYIIVGRTAVMPIGRIPGVASAAGGGGGVRDGTVVQHGDQSTSGQQQRQTGLQQRQVLQLRAAVIGL